MKIYRPSGEVILEIEPDEQSYRNRAIMEIGSVVLYYSLPHHIELPVGSYVDFCGTRYTLRQPEAYKMVHSEQYDYTVTMMAPEYGATVWMFANPIDHRLTFDLTATPREHLQMFVDNMNLRDSGWSIGECVDGAEKVITYDYTYCWDALMAMADTFHTEIEIVGKTVSLKMVEYRKNNPLPLCYGKGNGFRSGVGRGNDGGTPPVDRLYVQGGEQNIDYSKYGTYIPNDENPYSRDTFVRSNRLLLPRSVQYAFDGEKFEDEEGFVAANARHYVTDNLGLYVDRADSVRSTTTELAYDASEHYPKRVGKVTGVVPHAVEDGMVYDIKDSTIPYALDYNEYWIADSKMTIIFQTGMLAGREFDVAEKGYHHYEDGYSGGLFELVSREYDGMIMPNQEGGFLPTVGDEYIVVGCMLPVAYICENDTKTGAEWDMLRAAIRYRFSQEEYLYTFSGDIDEIWLHREWESLSARFRVGEYVRFRDSRIGTNALLRMTAIKDYINRPWKIELTLSNAPVRTDLLNEIRRISAQSTRAGRQRIRVATVPQGVQMHFRFIAGLNDYTEVVPTITYSGQMEHDEDAQMDEWVESVTIQGGYLQHRVVRTDVTRLRLIGRNTSESDIYTIHQGEPQEVPIGVGQEDITLYLYAKVKPDHTGTYTIQSAKHNYREGEDIWLYMGELSPVRDGQRTFERRWRWLHLGDNRVTISVHIGDEVMDMADLLSDFDSSIAGHSTAISTITSVVNNTVARTNDITNLITNRLVAAINSFNTAQGDSGNKIDLNFCIDDSQQGEPQRCKTFPDIEPIL